MPLPSENIGPTSSLLDPAWVRGTAVLAFSMIGLAGCVMSGAHWRPNGAVQHNIASEVQNPADLLTGHGDALAASGQIAVAALKRGIGTKQKSTPLSTSSSGGGGIGGQTGGLP